MKAFDLTFSDVLAWVFAILVVLIILFSFGESDAIEEDLCSIWSQFIGGEEERAAFAAACLTTDDDLDTAPTRSNTRAWILSGSRMQENGDFTVWFRLNADDSSDNVFYGCDLYGTFIAFDSLPWGTNSPTAIIEIGDSMDTYRGIMDNEILSFRNSILLNMIINYNDEVYVFINRDWDEAQQRRGERAFDMRGIKAINDYWLPRFCEAAGNPF